MALSRVPLSVGLAQNMFAAYFYVRRATCDVRRATCDVRRATCDVRRATYDVRRTVVKCEHRSFGIFHRLLPLLIFDGRQRGVVAEIIYNMYVQGAWVCSACVCACAIA